MASRKLDDLQPETREKALLFLELAKDAEFPVLIYCTYRSDHEQACLYRQSRSLPVIKHKADQLRFNFGRPDLAQLLMDVGPQYGRHVTNAGPGQSLHGYRCALDGVPLVGGKPVWDDDTPEERAIWARYGELVELAGLEWSGRWTQFKETPHAQEPGMDWRELIKRGP